MSTRELGNALGNPLALPKVNCDVGESTKSYTLSGYTSKTYSYESSSALSTPSGMSLGADGTKMFIASSGTGRIYLFTLATPYDISTMSFSTYVVLSSTSTINSLFFSNDGLNLYISEVTNEKIYRHTLTTAWDISTLSLSANSSFTSPVANPDGVIFNNTGTKMYISVSDRVYQYALNTAWNITTATLIGTYSSIDGDILLFSNNGKYLHCKTSTYANALVTYHLDVAYDTSTIIQDDTIYTILYRSDNPSITGGIALNEKEDHLFIVGNGTADDKIFEYKL